MVTLVFKKHFTKGNLAGLTITDHLPFVSNGRAVDWIEAVQWNTGLDWKVCKVSYGDVAFMVLDEDTSILQGIDVFEQWYEAWKQ